MKRIMIIGSPGSGKTTLSNALSVKLGIPTVHLDKLGWRGEWEQTPREEFDRLLSAELEKPEWIIDGNYNRTIPTRLELADTVIYLDFPCIVCLLGVLDRIFSNHGKSRPDMGGNCPEKIDFKFLGYVIEFKKKYRKKYFEMLGREKEKRVIILHSRREADRFIANLSN